MRRLSLVLGTLLALAIAVPVSANTVDRYPLTFDFTFVDFTCGFPTLADVTVNAEYQKDFYDNDGNLVKSLINGRQVATYSNPANGRAVVENVSSSGHIDYETNEFVLTGRSGISADLRRPVRGQHRHIPRQFLRRDLSGPRLTPRIPGLGAFDRRRGRFVSRGRQ